MNRDVQEIKMIKKVTEKIIINDLRMFRDQLYLIKINNAHKNDVLFIEKLLLSEIIKLLRKKNEILVTKMIWISRKNNDKVYSFMIVYLYRDSDVNRLLQKDYFYINNELRFINIFERHSRSDQYYNCQSINYKIYNCKKIIICVRCITKEYNHHNCNATLKCISCDELHKLYSKNCWVLYSSHNE